MAFGSGAQGYARAFSLSTRLETTFESIAAACRPKATAREALTWGRVSFVDMGVPEPLGNGNAAVFFAVINFLIL